MPSLVGYHHVSLSVTNADASAAWYCSVLGFAPAGEPFENREWGFRRARLRHPETGTRLALTAHFDGSGDRFSERRTGMDHVAFLVPGLDDLRTWEERLEQLGVEHSAIKPMADGAGGLITLRDPDNVQIELIVPGD